MVRPLRHHRGIVAIDTETTGLDIHHGCRPFFVSMLFGPEDPPEGWKPTEDNFRTWEWEVDPITRTPSIPTKDVRAIQEVMDTTPKLVFHNAKFDVRVLASIGVRLHDWGKVEETVVAHHCLASGESHKLKDLGLLYLDIDVEDQQDLRKAVIDCRALAEERAGWRIAKVGDPHFPTIKRPPKDGWWVTDMWLPRAVALADGLPEDHPWWTVLRKYATLDVVRTLGLWWTFKEGLKTEGLWEQYRVRRDLLEPIFRMEQIGVTVHKERHRELSGQFQEDATVARRTCHKLANNCVDNLDSPKQLQGALFGHFGLKPVRHTKTGYSTDADTLEALAAQTPRTAKAWHFLRRLGQVRKLDKMVDYLDSYLGASLPIPGHPDFFRIRPGFNITGTATTRFSSNEPNVQNVSKKEDFNLRHVFGPLPGRVWYSLDFENIEMRIPAYVAGEGDLIKLFETGGSYHLLVAEYLFPELYKRHGPDGFKKLDTYRDVKSGNFAIQYGGQKATVDATFGLPGAFEALRRRFPKVTALGDSLLEHAEEHGFVTTLGGYRLQCPRTDKGTVLSTTPLNYFTQGSAGWAMIKALLRCHRFLKEERKKYKPGQGPEMVLTIHDELVFDLPDEGGAEVRLVKTLKDLMEQSGEDLGLPLPVGVDKITTAWSEESPVRFDLAT